MNLTQEVSITIAVIEGVICFYGLWLIFKPIDKQQNSREVKE